jgi:hypothetical protein
MPIPTRSHTGPIPTRYALAFEPALKTHGKIFVSTHYVFHFCPFIFVFAGRFRIYENGRDVFPSVSAGSRFNPKLTRIYSVFRLF